MCLEDTVRIPLRARDGSVRAYALVDAADAEWVNQWRWCLTAGYASRRQIDGGASRIVYLHRELLSLKPGDGVQVDHINRNILDDRRANLRGLNRAGNAQNLRQRSGTSSSFRGVGWDASRGKWMAYVNANGHRHYVGRYQTEVEAAEAARTARQRLLPYATD